MREDRNMVVILTGGLRADMVARHHDWPLRTPNLNIMANQGLAMTGTTASPATTPARISLLTGLSPRQHGITDEGMAVDRLGGWVKQLDDVGYHIAGVGQVDLILEHLHEAAVVGDLNTADVNNCAYMRYARHRGLIDRARHQRNQRLEHGPFELDNFGLTSPSDDVDGFITHQALMTIEHLPKNKPWCLIVAYTGPGNDLPAPPAYLQRVDTKKLAKGFVPIDQRTADDYAESPYPRTRLQRLTPAKITEIRANYLARVAMLDNMLGLMRDTIERFGHAHDTWTLMASDAGRLLGERGLLGHRSMLGPAVSVPLWVIPPKGFASADTPRELTALNHRLIGTADWVASLCRIAMVDPPPGCNGQSLLPAMAGEVVGHEAVLSEFGTRLMLETMQHRVSFDIETDRPLSLFDLVKDPQEKNDLINTPQELMLMDMLRYQLGGLLMPLRPIRGAA